MTTRAFDKNYLDDVMTLCGAVLDYGVNACGQETGLFYARFLASGVLAQLTKANPAYIGRSGAELARMVAERTGPALPDVQPFIDIGSPEYWGGWTLAYVSWYLNVPLSVLHSLGIGINEMLARYSTLHEADLSKSVQFVQTALHKAALKHNPLKEARKNAGLTQEQLAGMTGLSQSTIRAYEQGQRQLAKASAAAVRTIRQVTVCNFDALLV